MRYVGSDKEGDIRMDLPEIVNEGKRLDCTGLGWGQLLAFVSMETNLLSFLKAENLVVQFGE